MWVEQSIAIPLNRTVAESAPGRDVKAKRLPQFRGTESQAAETWAGHIGATLAGNNSATPCTDSTLANVFFSDCA